MWHIVYRQYDWVQFETNIYETGECKVNYCGMAARYMEEKMNDFRREMTERTNLVERNERSRYKKRTNRIKSNGSAPFSEQVELEM
jgi:outer membrane receptor for Fe3+-dicitrate